MIQLPPISSFDSLIKAASATNSSLTSPSPGLAATSAHYTVGAGAGGPANTAGGAHASVPNNLRTSSVSTVSPRSSTAFANAVAGQTHPHGDRADSTSNASFNDSNAPQASQQPHHTMYFQRQPSNGSSIPVVVSSSKSFTDSLLTYQVGNTGSSSGSSPTGQHYRQHSYFHAPPAHANNTGSQYDYTKPHFTSNRVPQQQHQLMPKLSSGTSNAETPVDHPSPISDINGGAHSTYVQQKEYQQHSNLGNHIHSDTCAHRHSETHTFSDPQVPNGFHQTIPSVSSFQSHQTSPTRSDPANSNSATSSPQSVTPLSTNLTPDSIRNHIDVNAHAAHGLANVSVNAENYSNMISKKQPRKKKQCPLCGLFFSNLSTHKSTHLSPETRPFKCEVCSRGFARSNDLIRHKKLHWKDDLNQESMDFVEKLKCLHELKGTYKCPFNSNLINLDLKLKGSDIKTADLPFETSNCHSTGVFSRCDTFKNHLKALHFEYPPGTKKKDRANVAGHCKHCGKKFESIDTWLKEHVGTECGFNYTG